jgi:hypothetical protein
VLKKENNIFHGFSLLKEDTKTDTNPQIGDGPRRKSTRFKTFKGAELIWPNGVPVKCIVRNVSETGAKRKFLSQCWSAPQTVDILQVWN